MKKMRIASVILLLVSIGIFTIFQIYSKMVQDNESPKVTCETQELTVSVAATEKELMQGVSAVDNRSGDVSDTLVIESLSDFTEEGKRIATYAAVDESMNVGRCERTIVYEDYQAPVFQMSEPLSYPIGQSVNVLAGITASSVLDGDLTSKIKYSIESSVDTSTPGNYPVEFSVMDSAGKIVYLSTQIEIYEREYSGIEVNLTDYLVYVKQGSKFNAQKYYAGSSYDGSDYEEELTIESNVNTKEPGSYYVDYIVDGFGTSGKTRLVVVVQ